MLQNWTTPLLEASCLACGTGTYIASCVVAHLLRTARMSRMCLRVYHILKRLLNTVLCLSAGIHLHGNERLCTIYHLLIMPAPRYSNHIPLQSTYRSSPRN